MMLKKWSRKGLVRDMLPRYLFMNVVPVMVILFLIFLLAGRYIYNASGERLLQILNIVIEAGKEEMRNISLELSYVVNLDEGKTVSMISGDSSSEKEQARLQLENMYYLIAAPNYRLLDIQIYTRDGRTETIMRKTRYTTKEIQSMEWYQEAKSNPEQVNAVYDQRDYFYRVNSERDLMLIAALATESSGESECTVLYELSELPEMIREYNKRSDWYDFILVDETGIPVADMRTDKEISSELMEKLRDNTEGQISLDGMHYFFEKLSGTDLYLICLASEGEMLGKFWWFLTACFAVTLGMLLLFGLYIRRYTRWILVPLENLTEGMKRVEEHDLETKVEICSQPDIAEMIVVFNTMVVRIRELIEENEKTQNEKYQEELLALQAQMNPHFLLNTLNTLKFMASSSHYNGMRDMVGALENILSAVLDRNGGLYTLREEIQLLDSYIYIMQFRYMDSFEVDIRVEEEAKKCKVPKLILQPIVENSIMHGFDGMDERIGRIEITAHIQDGCLRLRVWDNGKGIDPEKIKKIFYEDKAVHEEHKGRRTIGIRNTDRRLQLNFGKEYGVEIHSQPGVFTEIIMTLPEIW